MSTDLQVLGRLIKQVQWRHHRAMDSRLRPHGITIVQWDALRAIVRDPGASARSLAAATFQSEQSFGVMAARMERNGLLTRTPGTGRLIEHRLTAEGERLLAVGTEVVLAVQGQTLGVLEPAERDQLADLLGRVLEAPLEER